MSKEKLSSDRINYIIWRYLIELNYCETAVRLQKEWNMKDPQNLPFAPYVQSHALVSILNRGLLYNIHEREFAAVQEQYDPSTELSNNHKTATLGFFGPVLPAMQTDDEYTIPSKHLFDSDQVPQLQAPPAKKPRLNNGCDSNIDLDQNTHDAVIPKVVESSLMGQNAESEVRMNGENKQTCQSPRQMPTPQAIGVSSGCEQGIQVENVHDLTSNTIYLELTDRPLRKGTIVTLCTFHPRDPNVLAAAGSDALARIWSLKSLPHLVDSPTNDSSTQIFAPHRNLFDFGLPVTTQATALSWASQGKYIAIASQPSDTGLARVDFWNEDGSLRSSNFGIEPPILDIQWNPSGSACLIISPRNDAVDASIMIIYPALETVIRHVLPSHNLIEQLLEVVWTSDDDFIVCGGSLLQSFVCSIETKTMVPGRKYDVPDGAALSRICFDPHTLLLASASDTGMIYIWGKNGQLSTFTAHQGVITLLTWQPLTIADATPNITKRLLASAGEDGAVSLWNALSIDNKNIATMTMRSGVSALEFSPDGVFLAGATVENIFIWKTDNPQIPQAIWSRQNEAGWETPLSSESTLSEEDICSLCWNAEGHRLAFGANNRLAVINFQL